MNPRQEQLQLRKEALTMRAELERIELAQHLSALRRPAEMSYKGLRLVSLLRVPVTALLANRFGNTAPAGMLGQVARYAGYVFAGWRLVRAFRDLLGRNAGSSGAPRT